jgi:uncharacterized membrane protein (DUF106 family)
MQNHMISRILQQRQFIVKVQNDLLQEQHLGMMPSTLLPMILLFFHQP